LKKHAEITRKSSTKRILKILILVTVIIWTLELLFYFFLVRNDGISFQTLTHDACANATRASRVGRRVSAVLALLKLSAMVVGIVMVVLLYQRHLKQVQDRLKLKQELVLILVFSSVMVVQFAAIYVSTADSTWKMVANIVWSLCIILIDATTLWRRILDSFSNGNCCVFCWIEL
jgi:hypothetical protein